MSESEIELVTDDAKTRRRRRRKRGAKKKSGFAVFSDQILAAPTTSPASSFVTTDEEKVVGRKLSSLELDDMEDSLSTAVAATPPSLACQVTPGSAVSTESMWELGSYEEELYELSSRPIIRSPMMMMATTESTENLSRVDELVSTIESVLGSINSVASCQISRLCVPTDPQRRLCIPITQTRTQVSNDFFIFVDKLKETVSESIDSLLTRVSPPENITAVMKTLDEVEMVEPISNVPVLNRRQKRSILFGAKGGC